MSIAQRAGVAKSTVSLALRGHPRISAQQRDRIRSIATEMGYRTNALVARLMHELRSERKQRYIGTLAFINASPLEPSRAQPSSIDENWQAGAGERASQLGYTLDSFRLHDPDVRPQRLARILHARNVQGVVFYSLDNDSKLENCEAVWEGFPCVSIGTRVRNPPLHFVCNDHYTTALHACDALRALGYRRIGLCTVRWLDNVLEHRFVAGYRQAMSLAAEGAEGVELPVFTLHHPHGTMKRHEEEDGRAFQTWVKKYRPDACLSVHNYVLDWARRLGLRLPHDLGVALLDLPKELRDRVAGMQPRPELEGMAAVDVVIGQILRREAGVPPFQQGTLIESSWVPGPTVRTA
ncbi:LacI family DNA-binding transcriptional regulator [Geminisphaera colitermitum]|uniref:LacI family DNA-binding transcriptional regulator n=1 Tax=Geminisphaera colitermitum TaxID=1148786 RepID=UPI0012FE883E|nr:LacI family DNA-binding transcriptional regulator [Geminisphaera colitermitum]